MAKKINKNKIKARNAVAYREGKRKIYIMRIIIENCIGQRMYISSYVYK